MNENKKRKRIKKSEDIRKQIEKARELEKQLQAELEQSLKHEADLADKYRTNAGMQIAGIVWRELGISWDTTDPEQFAMQFAKIAKLKYKDDEPIFDCAAPKADYTEAHKRWTSFAAAERKRATKNTRETEKAACAAAAEAAQAAAPNAADGSEMNSDKSWTCPECGQVGTAPANYYYMVCNACKHKFSI